MSQTDNTKQFVTLEDAQSQLRVSVSKALADALIIGIDEAEQEGRPLNQLQQIALAKMTIMAYDQAMKGSEMLKFTARMTPDPA